MRDFISARQSISPTLLVSLVGGLALFWACFFAMLMRNSFLDPGIDPLWYHLALRIAFFIGFGTCCLILSRTAEGYPSSHRRNVMAALIVLYSLIALASPLMYTLVGTPLPLAFDLIAWSFSGIGLSCLLFFWLPAIAYLDEQSAAQCLAFSTACGGFLYLVINLLPAYFGIVMLAICPLVSLGVAHIVTNEVHDFMEPVPFLISKKNAGLSWSFGVIYLAYGIVFGLGAGSITQLSGGSLLLGSIAVFVLAGSLAAFAFMNRFAGRMRQIDVLRMVFPFLVIALVIMSLSAGIPYALSNLLLLAAYVFLVVVSIAYEVQTARQRHASPLFFVGMSQTVLSLGMAVGFGVGLLPLSGDSTDFAMLSAVALGLVVLLAIFVTFAPKREADTPTVTDMEHKESDHEQGRWKACGAIVAQNSKLTARETEVFFLMAKGRGIEHIQNKLCISGHTVKTHTYNIYRKMGIGSREELLDAIEAADPGNLKDAVAIPIDLQ